MDCGMGTALGTAHLIAAFEEEQKVNYKNSISLSFIFSIQLYYMFFSIFMRFSIIIFTDSCIFCSE